MSIDTALKTLELSDDFTEKEFKANYWRLAKSNHPDNNNDTESKMKEINEAKIVIEKILKNRELKENKDIFLDEISKLLTKYSNTKIAEIAMIYKERLMTLSNIVDLINLKDKFYKEIRELKKAEILPNEKEKLINKISKYQTNHSEEIINLTSNYYILINECESLEELNTLKQKFMTSLKKLLVIEKKQIEEFNNLKESIKKSLIYYFYEYARKSSLENICLAYNLFIKSLELLNNSNQKNINKIYDEIKDITFYNSESELEKISLYLKEFDVSESDFINIKPIENENDISKYIEVLLDNYYLYITKKNSTVEKILKEQGNFIELINIINNSSLEKLEFAYKFLKNVSFKRMSLVLENITDFYDPSKIYIERETGNICIFLDDGKRVWTLYNTGNIQKNIVDKRDIIWNYISLYNFFKIANWTEGFQLVETSSNEVLPVNDYNSNDLFFTTDLALRYTNEDDKITFTFIPSLKGYRFSLGDSSQITKETRFIELKDKDTCLMEFMLFLNNTNLKNNKKTL